MLTRGHPKPLTPSMPAGPAQIEYPTDFYEHLSQDIQSLGNAYSTDHFRPGPFKPSANFKSSIAK